MKLRLEFYDNIVYTEKAILTANTFLININHLRMEKTKHF